MYVSYIHLIRTNSFCGDKYNTHGAVKANSSRACNMTLKLEPDVQAGGHWAMSVYDLGGKQAQTATVASVTPDGGVGAGTGSSHDDASSATEAGASDVVAGERAFTVVNQCSQTIHVGSTGGR